MDGSQVVVDVVPEKIHCPEGACIWNEKYGKDYGQGAITRNEPPRQSCTVELLKELEARRHPDGWVIWNELYPPNKSR